MPPRNSHRQTKQGFTLIEAVIVIAIMAILAGAAVPLMVQALNGQRTQRTRDMVRAAYEALVGARDHVTPNLITDVGFNPPALITDLRILTTMIPVGGWPTGVAPPKYPTTLPGGFTWGWNGPYWTGPVQPLAGTNGLPVDAWGRPLIWANSQVQSAGADGVFGTADDVVFPTSGATPPQFVSLTVIITRDLPTPVVASSVPTATFTVQVTDRFQQQNPPRAQTPTPLSGFTWSLGNSQSTGAVNVQPGAVLIYVTSSAGDQSQLITIAPGETNRIVAFRWNN
jgi:prepilin-type N-terminal cleavage/methylation domain-containing protein